jgi:FkbM family methyltransferase
VKLISPNARILAFEPNPTEFEALQTRWKNQSTIQVLPYAVSNMHGTLFFSLDGEQSNSREGGSVSIPCVNLNAFLKDPVAILKIDVEGHEPEILESIRNKYPIIHTIIFEFTPKWYGSKDTSVQLLKTLSTEYPYAYHLSRRHTIELYPLDLTNADQFVQMMIDTQYQTDIVVSHTPIQFPKTWP